MKVQKGTERIDIRVTAEQKNQIRAMAGNYNMPLSHYMVNCALNTHPRSPLYRKEVHDFLLNLETLLHSLSSYSLTDNHADHLRQELYKEAKDLWQSLKSQTEHI